MTNQLWPCRTAIALVVALLLVAGADRRAGAQTGVNPLTIFQNYFVTGDYVVAGWVKGAPDGSGFAPGTITVPDALQPGQTGVPASVPTGADIVAAYLYWATVETSGTPAGQQAYFNGYPITGTMLGNQKTPATWSGEGCAGASSGSKILHSYRADVRPFLPLDTNPQSKTYGTKVVNGVLKVRMADSGTSGGKVPISLGATLVVIYRSLAPAVPLNAIVLYDGDYAATNQSPKMSQTMIGFYQPANTPVAKLTHIVANGQRGLNELVYLNNSAQPLPSIYGAAPPFPGIYGTWDNPTWLLGAYVKNTDTSETTSVVPAPTGCVAWGATILSTTVQDEDADGLLDIWEQNQGYTDAVSKQWVPLPDAHMNEKDLFVEVDWLQNLDGKAGNYLHSHLPNVSALDAVGAAFLNENVYVHFDLGQGIYPGDRYVISYPITSIPNPLPAGTLAPQAGAGGNPISESQDLCKDPGLPTPTTLCAFPGIPALAWKGGFEYIKNTSTLGNFQTGRSKSYHYVLFGHALGTARSYWSSLGTALVSRQTAQVAALVPQLISIVNSGTSATVKIQSPTGLIKPGDCAQVPVPKACTTDLNTNRISISGALIQTALNGTYIFSNAATTTTNNVSTTTFKITTKGVATGTYNYVSEPQLAVAYLGPVSASGQSDFGGGGDSAVTFGLWTYDDPKPPVPACQHDPSQPLSGGGQTYCANQVGSIPEQTGTLMHEIGHSLSLTHGGTYFKDQGNPSLPFRELNCKPNFLSVMNYLFQVRGFVDGGFDFSSQTLQPLNESYLSQNGALPLSESLGLGGDIVTGAPALHLTRFYAPQSAADKLSGNHASSHCDGSPLGSNDSPEVRVDASVAPGGGTYSAPLDFNNDGTVPDAILPPTALPLSPQQIDLNYNGSTTDAPFSGYNDWEALNMQQIGSRQNAFGYSGGGVNFEGGGVNFEGGGVNFEGGGVDNDGGGVNFEGGGVNFEGGGVNFEGGGVNFEGGGIDQDLDTAAATADPPTGLLCTTAENPNPPVQYAPNGAPACVGSNGIYTEQGQAVPLSWTAPGFGQTRVYTIYRALSPSTTFTAIATLSGAPPVTSYIDTGVDFGNTYTYYMTDTNLQGAVSGTSNSFTVTINKGSPIVITWPTASNITYGQQLSSSTLNGGSATIYDQQANVAVPGTFTFSNPTSMPHAGTAMQNVTFTPTDLTDYSIVNGTVSVTVNPKPITITATGGSFTYGGTPPTINPTVQAGSFVGTDSFASLVGLSCSTTATSASHVSGNAYTSSCSGGVDTDYTISYVNGSVTVNPKPLSITASSGSFTYGGTPPAITPSLTAGSVFVNGDSFASLVGLSCTTTAMGSSHVSGNPYPSSCSGGVDTDYTISYVNGSVTVNPKPLSITASSGSFTYGGTPPAIAPSLTAGSVFVNGDSFASLVGLSCTTTAMGSSHVSGNPYPSSCSGGVDTDYAISYVAGMVTINKATPTISTVPTATAITYGQTLASSTLSGGSASYNLVCCGGNTVVLGTFAFITPTKAPGAGMAPQAIIFNPTDSGDYNTAVGSTPFNGSASVTVNKATPTILTVPTATPITYGQTLASSTLSGGSASYNLVCCGGNTVVPGSFAFVTPTKVPGGGTAPQAIIFNPTDSTDYNTAVGSTPFNGSVNVTVNPAPQTISFTQPTSPVTYGVSPITLVATSTSGLTVMFQIDGTSTATGSISGNILTVNSAGTLVIDASQPGSTNYLPAAPVQQTIVVNPAGYVVTSTSDDSGTASNCTPQTTLGHGTDNSCSLRDVLLEAAATGGGNITFDATVFAAAQTITLTNGTLSVPSKTTIAGATTGSGASLTNLVTVDGNNASTVFTISSGVTGASIANLIIRHGSGSNGGGINNAGTLTLPEDSITGNSASGAGGGIENNGGRLTLSASTVSGNSAAGNGGGIDNSNSGTLTSINDTISGNSASGSGGGTYNSATLAVSDSTLSGNSAATASGGGGIDNVGSGNLTLGNAIVSGNTASGAPDDFDGTAYTGPGGNVVGANAITLAPLGNYGGPTQTQIPLPGSPAICAGSLGSIPAALTADQRGLPNTNTSYPGYSSPACVDAGSVQTNYALSFTTNPSGVSVNTNFSAGVTLNESGNPFQPSITIPLTLNGSGTLTGGGSTATSAGVASYTLQIDTAAASDTLVANLPLNGTPSVAISATSNSFAVAGP